MKYDNSDDILSITSSVGFNPTFIDSDYAMHCCNAINTILPKNEDNSGSVLDTIALDIHSDIAKKKTHACKQSNYMQIIGYQE